MAEALNYHVFEGCDGESHHAKTLRYLTDTGPRTSCNSAILQFLAARSIVVAAVRPLKKLTGQAQHFLGKQDWRGVAAEPPRNWVVPTASP
jgi:hypothetical protein